ncbi:helix-turn-helix domain-containing protein [Streptomyces sp. NPDC001714]|uniref:helix-turn-helix transcriptional regulator n=1 Tax=Streptomyces sp. NPDC001714 TaxID=3364603 RepID=UPI0036CDD1F9
MLKSLGLDSIAEAVYRALLAQPRDGVAELAERLKITPEQVRQGLDTLSELALLRPSYDREGELWPVSPEVGLELLMARQQAELAAHHQRLEESREAATRLIADYAAMRPADPHPNSELLNGIDQIRDRLAALTRETREEVMTFAPDGPQRPEHIEAAKPLNLDLLDRGVRMRTVYLNSARNSVHTLEYVSWLSRLGGQVRTVPTLPTRMIVVDRTTAVIPVNSDNSAEGAVVLTGHGTLTALCALFDSVWHSARPLNEESRADDQGLTDQQSMVVILLAEGHTDETIAKRLGVSPRTARRLASELMTRLGARSRFEAGVRAVQNGWLSDDH